MEINNILNTQETMKETITQSINDTNGILSGTFSSNQQVKSDDSNESSSETTTNEEDNMNNLLNNIGLEIQRREGGN